MLLSLALRSALLAAVHWAPSVPNHVPTMAYVGEDGYDDPGPALVQRYVTYMRGPLQSLGGSHDCPVGGACQPLYYLNTHNVYCTSGTLGWFTAAQSHPSWWLHTTVAGNVVPLSAVTKYGHCPSIGPFAANTYYPNTADAGNLSYWRGYVARKAAAAQGNQCFFLDDVAYYVYHKSNEIPDTDSLLSAEGNEFDSLAPHCIWTNGLGPGGGYYGHGVVTRGGAVRGSVPIDAYTRYSHAGNVAGVTFENPLWSASDGRLRALNLPVMINTISLLLAETRLRIAVLDFSADTGGSSLDQVRRLHTAALWMVSGNSLDRTVSWLQPAKLPAKNRPLGIYPEELVVPTSPVKPLSPWAPRPFSDGSGCRADPAAPDGSTGGMADLLVMCGSNNGDPAGVYVREYAACYANGREIGRCAAVINLEDRPVQLDQRGLSARYGFALGWIGGPLQGVCPTRDGCDGVLEVHAHRVPISLRIPPQDALLLVK